MSEQRARANVGGAGNGSNLTLRLTSTALFAAASTAFAFLPYEAGMRIAAILVAFFAILGFCGFFLFAAGILPFSGQSTENIARKQICDKSSGGLVVVGSEDKVLYANKPYLALSGAKRITDVRSLARLFSKSPEASGAIHRLALAARAAKPAVEDIRVSPPFAGSRERAGYKVKVEPLPLPGDARASLWSIIETSCGQRTPASGDRWRTIDLLDQAPAGIFCMSPHGEITYMNETLLDWLGYDQAGAGAVNLNLADFVASEGDRLIAPIQGAAGETCTAEFDAELKCRDRQSLPVRLLHRVSFGQDGAISTSCTLVLKRGAADGRAAPDCAGEGSYAEVLAALPIPAALLRRSGQILSWNAAFSRLMPEAVKSDGNAVPAIFPAILSRDHASLDAALAASFCGTPDIRPVDVGLAGKGDRSVRVHFAPASGQIRNAAAVLVLDTTGQHALRGEYAQSNKMQAVGQLAGGVAHDFNNVLTAIIGHCDLLLANHRPTDPSFRDINQIKQNANRAAALVRQLLAFSRRQTLRPQVLQLGDVLCDLQEMMKRLVGERMTLELRHGRDLWLVKADLNQFEQVLINLIVNSRDAMPQGGTIILRTRNVLASQCSQFNEPSLVPNDYVAIEVEDFGHGIPPEVRDRIFEPFFTTKEAGKGTGLGLATVYGIIKQTEGYVFCASAVGKGTTFTVLLPRHRPDDSGDPQTFVKVEASSGADFTGHGTILLVEDEEAVRAFGARALASRGYSVLQAASGAEALQIVEEKGRDIDLIVSDVMMPEMDGPTMLTELRRRGVKARVIFVSGYAEDAFANLPKGEDFGFLPKPFSLKQLIEAVKGQR